MRAQASNRPPGTAGFQPASPFFRSETESFQLGLTPHQPRQNQLRRPETSAGLQTWTPSLDSSLIVPTGPSRQGCRLLPMNKPMYIRGLFSSKRCHASIIAAALYVGFRANATADPRDMVAWYNQPAQSWTDASPLGNGLTAAMVFGGTKTERIALNNSSFWSGKPHDYDDPNAGKYFDQIKALMAEQKFQEAEKLVDDHFWGIPKGQQAYQPIGDLALYFDGVDDVSDYRRELKREPGVVKVTYRSGGIMFTHESF